MTTLSDFTLDYLVYANHDTDALWQKCVLAESWLDAHELARLEKVTSTGSRREFLLGRWLIKSVLAKRLKIAPPQIRISYTANGKPYLKGDAIHFNLSHCEEAIALAVGLSEVGLDIETNTRALRFIENSLNFFPQDVAQQIATMPQERAKNIFMQLWTTLEARVKLQDSSLFRLRKNVSLELMQALEQENAYSTQGLWLRTHFLDNGLCVALASKLKPETLNVNPISF